MTWLLRLPRRAFLAGWSEVRIARAAGDRRAPPWLDGAFGLHRHERVFVRALLERHAELWVFRPESTRACGDLVLVDMAACLERRTCLVLELKARSRLRVGSRHVQLAARDEAVTELASRGVVSPTARVVGTFGAVEVAQVPALLRA